MPGTEQDIRAALQQALGNRDFEEVKTILSRPHPTPSRLEPSEWLENAATRAIEKSIEDGGDLNRIQYLFKEWHAYTSMPLPSPGKLESALVEAIEAGQKDVVKLLLANGAGVTRHVGDSIAGVYRDDPSRNPNNFLDILQDLLDHELEVHMRCHETPLLLVSQHNPILFEWLLDHGADPNATYKGSTALRCSADWGTLSMVEHLFSKGARVDDNALHMTARREEEKYAEDRIAIASCLLEHGADINALETGLETRPSSSARIGPQPAKTPLFEATWHQDLEMVEFLLCKGADPEKRNEHSKFEKPSDCLDHFPGIADSELGPDNELMKIRRRLRQLLGGKQ